MLGAMHKEIDLQAVRVKKGMKNKTKYKIYRTQVKKRKKGQIQKNQKKNNKVMMIVRMPPHMTT